MHFGLLKQSLSPDKGMHVNVLKCRFLRKTPMNTKLPISWQMLSRCRSLAYTSFVPLAQCNMPIRPWATCFCPCMNSYISLPLILLFVLNLAFFLSLWKKKNNFCFHPPTETHTHTTHRHSLLEEGLTKQLFFSTGMEQAGGCQAPLIAADNKDNLRLKKKKESGKIEITVHTKPCLHQRAGTKLTREQSHPLSERHFLLRWRPTKPAPALGIHSKI